MATRPVSAVAFVDAGVPPFEGGAAPTASAELHAFLAGKADRVERQQRRLPLSYFRDTVPAPRGWDDRPCGYLAFGSTYLAETDRAVERGWAVRLLDGEHLEMTVHPRAVADQILALLAQSTRQFAER